MTDFALDQATRSANWKDPKSRGRILVVGDPFFLSRHRPLTDAIAQRLGSIRELEISEGFTFQEAAYLARGVVSAKIWPPLRASAREARQRFRKQASTFDRVSRLAESQITNRRNDDFVLQLMSMSSPVASDTSIPYAHYVDMTMAQVSRSWPAWAPYDRVADYEAWIAREGASYRGAARVFTFSEATRRSVIVDYVVDPARVVAVGAAGYYDGILGTRREYGNRSIVFYGADFLRKGGDRALVAFHVVRERYPEATLTIVGGDGHITGPAISDVGRLSREELFALFDRTDVLLAPTCLDIFPGFTLEAMSRGVVPVVSDAESMDEMVADGVDGYVVSPPTADNLASRVIRLFEDADKLRDMGEACRERVVRDWNWYAVADRMIASLSRDGLI